MGIENRRTAGAGAGTSIDTVLGGNPGDTKNEASVPLNTIESAKLCGTGKAIWEGSYITTNPLYISQ
jgi:hypothetical protein